MQYDEDYEYITKSLNRKARRKGKTITDSTIRTYVTAVNSYVKFLDKSFSSTLELDVDEIRDLIEDYKDYLIDEDKANSTINKRVDLLKALYKLGKKDLGSIEKLVVRESNDPDRLPNKKEIRQVLNTTNNKQLKAIILFMATSGCAINEVTNISVGEFKNSLAEYTTSEDITEIIDELWNKSDIIPTIKVHRRKTDFFYYTCCTPETTTAIIRYLSTRTDIDDDELLFTMTKPAINQAFRYYNDKLGFGKIDSHRKFHPHGLRKFFATQLTIAGVHNEDIDRLLGHKVKSVLSKYSYANKNIKSQYMKGIEYLKIEEDSEEVKQLKQQIRELEEIIVNKNKKIAQLEGLM
ncbi:MAG: site-specific integrase [Methanosphaera sp.]|nr:site-specific integrase [Methanosphaera sp.]